ncbi:MAG: FmdB family transcriptional regulator [Planctomycetaceae bacterium]|nr:FmdB family transcriptional regulator [Planctomycetaceae bacterium]
MPLYEFVCDDCQREQEHLVRGEETPECEQCGGSRLTRLLSVPAAHTHGGGGQLPQAPPPGPCGGSCSCFPGG